jgi:DNA polymerase elongation subunit (family B)
VSGKLITMTKPKFVSWMKAENLTLSKAGVLFSQKKKGIIPDFVDRMYKKRVKVQKELKAKRQELVDLNNEIKGLEDQVAS